MNQAKIRLSAKEIELVNNTDWILTKNDIIQKIINYFSLLQQEQEKILQRHKDRLPFNIASSSPKISKGENYKGLPYIVLDYPRFFDAVGFGAIRTMFWWGNFFSVTLHLSGDKKKYFSENIVNAFSLLKEKRNYICVNNREWEHTFTYDNFIQINQLDIADYSKLSEEKTFLKLAQKITLDKWETAEKYILESFSNFITILAG